MAQSSNSYSGYDLSLRRYTIVINQTLVQFWDTQTMWSDVIAAQKGDYELSRALACRYSVALT